HWAGAPGSSETTRRASAIRWSSGSRKLARLRIVCETRLLRLLWPVPPGFRKITGQSCGFGSFYPIPARDPLLLDVKNRDGVKSRHQHAVKRAHRRDEDGAIPRREHIGDHGIDRRILGAHIVARALGVGRFRSKVEVLLVAGR